MSNIRDAGIMSRGVLCVGTVLCLVCVLATGTVLRADARSQVVKGTDVSLKARPGSIAGRITIQGKPASGLAVALHPRHYHILDKTIATTSTDTEGRYHFSSVPPGHYWIQILAREYVSSAGYFFDGPGRDLSLADGAVPSKIKPRD